jgi:hypothetical protein
VRKSFDDKADSFYDNRSKPVSGTDKLPNNEFESASEFIDGGVVTIGQPQAVPRRSALLAFSSTMLMLGCGTTTLQVTSNAAPSYEPLDFDKWTSNMYADRFNGRWIVADLYFLMPLTFTQGLDWYDFGASKDPALNGVAKIVMVRAPMSMRDVISQFSVGRPFRIYGQAQLKADGGLYLVAQRIELQSA